MHKNFPADGKAVGRSIHDAFATPIATLRESALSGNLENMRRFCADNGLAIAPHGKTTMSPELIGRQLSAGAWGMTAANAWQARSMIEFGATRVIVANICIDPVGLRWIAEHMRDHPEHEIMCFVDSVDAVHRMRSVLADVDAQRSAGHGTPAVPPLPVLVELGFAGGRCGARTVADALGICEHVAETPELELAGVAGFEGAIGSSRDDEVLAAVEEFLGDMRRVAEESVGRHLVRAGRGVVVSAGGSAYFDLVQRVLGDDRARYGANADIVLRSGCYLVHDHGLYARLAPHIGFEPALEVWTHVLSTPEPGLAILDAGRRDLSYDIELPMVVGVRHDGVVAPSAPDGLVVDKLNDQHAFVRGDGLRVGDRVALGISHPCTTFDKWRAVPVVDDDYVVQFVAHTAF